MQTSRKLAEWCRVAAWLGAIGLAWGSGASAAQTGPAQPGSSDTIDLEEITVTAQKIEQRLIDVPISMTVIDSDELDALRVQGLKDYVFTLPNVTFTQSERANGVNIVIRGVSSQGGNFATATSTIDGISYNLTYNNQVMSLRSFDTESISLMRGPQGTMSGALAVGGLIDVVTVKPSTEYSSGEVTLDYGRFDSRLVKASYNQPLGEKFAIRGSAFFEQSDGAVENLGPAGGSSSTDNQGGRLVLRWKPTDALTIDLAATYDEQDYGMNDMAYFDEYYDGPNATSAARAYNVAFFEAMGGEYKGAAPFWKEGSDSNGSAVLLDSPEGDHFYQRLYSLHANYRFGSHEANLLYGSYDYDRRSPYDGDNSQYGFNAGTGGMDVTTDTAELRFSSKYDGALNWVAGVYYQSESFGADDVGYLSELGLALNEGSAPDPTLSQDMDYFYYAYTEGGIVESRALFANVFYDFAERWHLSVGARYTQTDVGGSIVCCAGDEYGTAVAGRSRDDFLALIADRERQTTTGISNVNPRIALNYDVRDNVSAYVQFGTGFRPAIGNDARAVEAGVADEIAKSEFVENYEVGLKGAFLNGRLSLASALFYMDYTDLQVFYFLSKPVFEVEYLVNAGSAGMHGFEIESAFAATQNLTLRATVGYTDSKISEISPEPGVTLTDTKIPGVRPWTSSFSGIYERPVAQKLRAGLRADYYWQAKPQATEREFAWETLDLSAHLASDRWEASLYLENALDDDTRTGINSFSGFVPSVFFVPRTYGLRFTYRFGE